MIDNFSQVVDKLPIDSENAAVDASNPTEVAAKVQEGTNILEQIKRLKDRMSKNLELEWVGILFLNALGIIEASGQFPMTENRTSSHTTPS
jgi:hypothetical protein